MTALEHFVVPDSDAAVHRCEQVVETICIAVAAIAGPQAVALPYVRPVRCPGKPVSGVSLRMCMHAAAGCLRFAHHLHNRD